MFGSMPQVFISTIFLIPKFHRQAILRLFKPGVAPDQLYLLLSMSRVLPVSWASQDHYQY